MRKFVKLLTILIVPIILSACDSYFPSSTSTSMETISLVDSNSEVTTSTTSVENTSLSESSTISESTTSSYFSETISESTSLFPSEPINEITNLDFFNLNDFHGSVAYNSDNDEPGISRLARYFSVKKANNPQGTIITSSGDMWQGSADSNITKGRLVTDAMNLIGFDAMALGNHEFDWGTDYIRTNRDMADFPFLGANIIERASGEVADFADSYTMIERQGVRIGIIGTIGASLESSIMPSMVADYDFQDITTHVISVANELENLGAHVTILLNHYADVPAEILSYVDVVFNAHSHSLQSTTSNGVPLLQARSNGKSVATARLSYNRSSDIVTVLDYGVDDYIIYDDYQEDVTMASLYQTYYDEEIATIKDEVIGTATSNFGFPNIGNLAVQAMLNFGETYGAIAAFHNSGGVRSSIAAGMVTYGDVYKALPFDNDLIVLELTGYELKEWLGNGGYVAGIDSSNRIEATGQLIVNSATYKIITINYVSENINYYPHDVFSEFNTYAYVRDLVAEMWRNAGTLNPSDYQ